jgi:YD repeat-containing protein
MTVRIGDNEFDVVRYDEAGDILYLIVGGAAPEARTDATPEGHAVTWDDSGRVIGMTIVNAKWLLQRDGKITMTVPDLIEMRAEEIEPALSS